MIVHSGSEWSDGRQLIRKSPALSASRPKVMVSLFNGFPAIIRETSGSTSGISGAGAPETEMLFPGDGGRMANINAAAANAGGSNSQGHQRFGAGCRC